MPIPHRNAGTGSVHRANKDLVKSREQNVQAIPSGRFGLITIQATAAGCARSVHPLQGTSSGSSPTPRRRIHSTGQRNRLASRQAASLRIPCLSTHSPLKGCGTGRGWCIHESFEQWYSPNAMDYSPTDADRLAAHELPVAWSLLPSEQRSHAIDVCPASNAGSDPWHNPRASWTNLGATGNTANGCSSITDAQSSTTAWMG